MISNEMRMIDDDKSGCFSITFKDMEEAFINIYYDDDFRDDVIITPMSRNEAREFAIILKKMIKRRLKYDIK